MRAQLHKPKAEDAVESPNTGADDSQRVNVESPVDTDADGNTSDAHTPRPHPSVEEPQEKPEEHAPETEPDSDPDAGSEQPRRPRRPGKAPR